MSEAKSTSDMRDFLLGSMQDVRDGKMDAASGRAIADMAKQVNDSARLDLECAEYIGDTNATPMQIVNEKAPQLPTPVKSAAVADIADNRPAPTTPNPDIVMSHYDDGTKPKDIAVLVGSDIKTVTKIINENR